MHSELDVRLMVFDVNGTLFNDTPLFISVINCILAMHECPEVDEPTFRSTFGQPWTSIFRDAGINEDRVPDRDLYVLYNQFYKDGLQNGSEHYPTLFPEEVATLDWLQGRDLLLAILSTQKKQMTVATMKAVELAEDKFAEILGGISDKASALRKLAGRQSFVPGELAYVGDQVRDIEYANAAGVVSVAFTGGVHSEERLRAAGPDHVIDTFSELRDLPMF